MANNIEPSNLKHENFIDAASRYNKSDIVYYGERRFVTFKTYKRENYSPAAGDRFYMITKGTEYRPDLVSNRAFGSSSYWWRILEANNMKDILEFKSGVNILIPGII